jgi:membrane dipeptidase
MNTPSVMIDTCAWEFDGFNDHLRESCLTAFHLTVASAKEDSEAALRQMEEARTIVARDPEKLMVVENASDIELAAASGRVGIIFHFQNARPISDDLQRLATFHKLGLRVLQLTYNERNFVGDGCLESSDAGLSRFGQSVIAALNDLGVLIDLSHVGRRSSLEAIDASAVPCTFSHSNPKRRANNPRNIDDEQIKACAARGGVIGICGWGPISWTGSGTPPDLNTIADHLDYVANMVGPEHTAIATDAPISGNMNRILAHFHEINTAYGDVTGPFLSAFGNDLKYRFPLPIRRLPELAEVLRNRGWSESDVQGAMGENMMRLYRHAWHSGKNERGT